ncbi:MAG: UDP-N-acetyl-alpha-D-glucosamine C6 dehydratase [Syntrophomonadaceae bacterium]|nr:UDP-N-acetyl-alpha-D-glucosamine C6 dehydratase [Bacillota bacterium]
MFSNKRFLLPVIDAVIVTACMYLALLFRFEGRIDNAHMASFLRMLPIIIFVRPAIFWLFGLYKGMWRYAGLRDLSSIIKAVTLGSVVLAAFIFFLRLPYSRGVFAIDWLLNLVLVGGERFAVRALREWRTERVKRMKRILIVGAGDAGEMILREIRSHLKSEYLVIGFIDDHRAKQGMSIHGVKVLGRRHDIPQVVKQRNIEEIIIAMPSASGKIIRDIVSICEGIEVKCRTIPGLNELIYGRVSIKEIRDITLKDLLRRAEVKMDLPEIASYLEGKRVLVTGAAGSIGSETCRQIAQLNASEIIALDYNENGLFFLEHELKKDKNSKSVSLKIALGDIKDKEKMRLIFARFQPEIIFHAAAYKHVPLMEDNPAEAIKNNINGTANLVDLADEYGGHKFINISTDKAVNPISVMGASKRMAEMLGQSKDDSKTCFISVRFGNVLGSDGSVVPLFRRQIAEGGPVTVTHPEATRYFMTIPEAVQLILQAGAMGRGGEIFVLDMGEPIKIVDLARDLIRFSGFEPDEDISIEFIGLRPGEKLHEEPLRVQGAVRATIHECIFVAEMPRVDGKRLKADVEVLKELAREGNRHRIAEKLKEMIPEYRPNMKKK